MPTTWPTSSPTNWTVCQTQLVLSYQWEEARIGDEIVTAFRDGQVTLRKNRREAGFTNALKEIGYQHISKGSLVVHSMDGGFGAIGVSDSDGKASPVVHAYESEHCDLRFVAYFLRAAVDAGWVAANGKGIRQRSTQFDRPALAQLKIAFPSREQQRRIADYLDRETGEIDAMIAKMDELAEALRVRRNKAVAEYMESRCGNEPMIPLGVASPFTTGATPPTKNGKYFGEGFAWANISDLGPKTIDKTANSITPEGVAAASFGPMAQPGDLLFSFKLSVGTVSIAAAPMLTNEAIATFRPDGSLDMHFAYYMLPLYLGKAANVNIYGAPLLNAGIMNRARVPVPHREKQQRIADHLDLMTSRIDKMLAKVAELKSLLTERRAALITEVVTGRKEVA